MQKVKYHAKGQLVPLNANINYAKGQLVFAKGRQG